MTRVAIPVTTLERSGTAPPAQVDADATNGNQLDYNDGRTILEIVSSDAGSQYVDIPLLAVDVDGQPVTPRRVTVPAGETRITAPFSKQIYSNPDAIAADGLLTSDTTAPANNNTVTIGSRTYTFKTALTGAADEVLIGADAAAALTNLKAAINHSAGVGTTYGTGTVVHPTVTAGTLTSATLAVAAKTAGSAGNAIATTKSSSHLSWGDTTLVGGTDPGSLLIDPSVSTTLKLRAFTY